MTLLGLLSSVQNSQNGMTVNALHFLVGHGSELMIARGNIAQQRAGDLKVLQMEKRTPISA